MPHPRIVVLSILLVMIAMFLLTLILATVDYTSGDVDIVLFNKRMERRFATRDSIFPDDWFNALPTLGEIQEMKSLIRSLFSYETFENLDREEVLSKFPLLSKTVVITTLSSEHCAVHEKFNDRESDQPARFRRFWGYFVIASPRWAEHAHLHHSAPHFQSDGEVCAQAAAMFQQSRSRSLVIAGASRFAVKGAITSKCQIHSPLADAAHNNNTMFHVMNIGILEATRTEPSNEENVFIQWHGMADTSCGNIAVFGSAGVDETNAVYNSTHVAVNQIVAGVNAEMRGHIAKTPATAKCALKATTNVFGRVVNGVPDEDVCTHNTHNPDVPGHFVHLEQKGWIVNDWDLWTRVLYWTFPI